MKTFSALSLAANSLQHTRLSSQLQKKEAVAESIADGPSFKKFPAPKSGEKWKAPLELEVELAFDGPRTKGIVGTPKVPVINVGVDAW